MNRIVFFIYNGKAHEADLLSGTYWEIPSGVLTHRQTVLNRAGIPWMIWISADGQTAEVSEPRAFGIKIG